MQCNASMVGAAHWLLETRKLPSPAGAGRPEWEQAAQRSERPTVQQLVGECACVVITVLSIPLANSTMSQFGSQTMALHKHLCRSGTSMASLAPKRLSRTPQRNIQDIAITRTGKPILRISGGRCATLLSTHLNRLLTC